MSLPYTILGLGQPLVDIIARVDDKYLTEHNLEKGGSVTVASHEDLVRHTSALTKIDHYGYGKLNGQLYFSINKEVAASSFAIVAGGSCANTIKGLASLGQKCAVIGKVGRDEMGRLYQQSISQRGVIPLMSESLISPTGQVLCLVTPDGQRTMRAYLGASLEMSHQDLLPQDFDGISLLLMEGYCVYNQPLTLQAMSLAKKYGAMISFDLGSFEVVRHFRPLIIDILKEYVDIVFCNEEEAREILNSGNLQHHLSDQQNQSNESTAFDPRRAADYLSTLCKVAVVMMGERGCYIGSEKQIVHCPGQPVTAVDTTGAGDIFASGFLYGYLSGYTLEQCARLGNLAGARVVQVLGAEISQADWAEIKLNVNDDTIVRNTTRQHSPKSVGSFHPFSSRSSSSNNNSRSNTNNNMASSLPMSHTPKPSSLLTQAMNRKTSHSDTEDDDDDDHHNNDNHSVSSDGNDEDSNHPDDILLFDDSSDSGHQQENSGRRNQAVRLRSGSGRCSVNNSEDFVATGQHDFLFSFQQRPNAIHSGLRGLRISGNGSSSSGSTSQPAVIRQPL